ncbi:MAG: hypothetical protein U0573_12575 [Phycisphaerales bacterium]|nr:hypothetical protein [Planctomycetota bacterium]
MPDRFPQIILALMDPSKSLTEVAAAFQLSTSSLREILDTPQALAAIESHEKMLLARARLLIAAALPNIVRAINRAADECNAAAAEPAVPNPQPATRPGPTTRQTIFQAARLLIQIARYTTAERPKPQTTRMNTLPPRTQPPGQPA